ncbi:hypothetical protein [Methylobacter tundripaludum]|uniref:Uncharacterized protein n=1 Tax=Methylobacter tundripaludum (strain ATCC BAA-1195 / DSM 17260 / SV96) TaxID=697282 RepID=G3IQH5_METTV|nr:hypothetical protein [Methylobacter tundripaludum]EGW22061.1 hypothetical protein Mettu_0859 [Methylobacter tundripaludum SV96]
MATLTVKISQSGTTYDFTGNSLAGHVWLSADIDGTGSAPAVSMGFAPRTDEQGKPFAAGDVHPDDDQKYLETYYTGTIVISDSQYSQLVAFANSPESYGFSTFYNVLTNSCIDFAWKGLEVIGLNSNVN